MKKSSTASTLFRSGLAVILACGLMLPSAGFQAYGDEEQAADLSSSEPEVTTENIPHTDKIDSLFEALDGATRLPLDEQAASTPLEASLEEPTTQEIKEASDDVSYSETTEINAEVSPQADTRASDYTKSGLTVSGGTLNVDFKDTGSALEVLTSTPLTFTGTSTYAIHIGQGVKADITLAGVTLTGASTIEVLTNQTGTGEGTYCYLTIKDGTTNTLRSASGNGPGLRCGKTSTLVIDDEMTNVVAGGSKFNLDDIITPKKGKVGYDGATYNGTAVTVNSPLDVLDSPNPGTLKAYARSQSAGIGGSPTEDSGTLVFNGGNIIAMGSCQSETNLTRTADDGTDDGGAGIGAGNMANGTITIFNGGNILAKAAFHGSGIGGGYCNAGYFSAAYNVSNPNAIRNTSGSIGSKSVAGDITINGGYIRSYASGHGNAFGQACCGNNNGKTITVTGGTLLPWSNSGYYDIGGAGGNVIITGGSIRLTGAVSGQAYTGNKFQSSDNKAYNALPGVEGRQNVFMFCIDLSKSDGIGTEPVASWDLLIGGLRYEYGAPSYFDEGKLYLWLPTTAVGKEITVRVKKYNADGTLQEIEDLVATPENSSGAGLGKRWISYKLTDDFMAENEDLFTKYYDGNSILSLITSLEDYVNTKGLPAPFSANPEARLTQSDGLLYQSAKLGDNGEPIEEYYPAEAAHDHESLPEQSGVLSVRVQSREYATPGSTTAESFWGHSTDFNVTINPVNSNTTFIPYTLAGEAGEDPIELNGPTWLQDENGNLNEAKVNHLIVPVDVTSYTYPNGDTVNGSNMSSTSCKAPYGQVQLFLDGDPISVNHGGVKTFTREDLENPDNKEITIVKDAEGREHTVLLFELSRTQLEAHGLKSTDGDMHTVTAAYTSRTDAKPATESLAQEDADVAAQADESPLSVYRNYYDSMTDETLVEIQKADCKFNLYNEYGTAYDPNNDTSTPVIDDAHKAQTVFYDIKDFTDGNPNTFPLYIDTDSMGAVKLTSSNPGVLTIDPSTVPHRGNRFDPDNPSDDFGFGATATVHAAGRTTITATIESTGAFKEGTYTFDVYIYPDPSAKPVIDVVERAFNLSRNDGTIRPYDTLRYTATYTNTTPNSSFQNPVLTISVPRDTSFESLSVITPEGETRQLVEGVDYTRASVMSRVFTQLLSAAGPIPALQPSTEKITVDTLTALFGNQSYQLVMETTVNPNVVTKTANEDDFYSQADAHGVYGIDPVHDATYPWDTRFPAEGTPVDEAWNFADPTSVEPEDEKQPTIEEIIGGGLIQPDPVDPDDPDNPVDPGEPGDPDNPGTTPRPGVEVGTVVPGGPLDTAEKPDPDNPNDPDKRTPSPITPGDRIVSVGDLEDPKTPDEVNQEIKDQIKKKLEEDPDATEVEIPVIIERENPDPDPDDPSTNVIREEVIITIPIPEGYDPTDPDPDDRNDHELIIIPADPTINPDPETGEDPDIVLDKSAENITEGKDKRGNQSITQVGDTIRYTITISNTKPGTSWYDVVIRDLIPKGMSYIKGTAVITDATDDVHKDFDSDFADGCADVAFAIGDLPGGTSATIVFDCKVTPELLGAERPVNIASAKGTNPTDTIKPVDPNNPDGPVIQDRDPLPPGPVDPSDPDIWPEDIETPKTPETPIDDVVPANPNHELLDTDKVAENIDPREDGEVYVGDILRYTITFTNTDEPWTAWYDVVLQDKLPAGIEPMAGTIKLILPDGTQIDCADDVYDTETREIALFVGVVFGGEKAQLVFDSKVTEDAIDSDIGNIAYSYGTDPSETDNTVLGGKPSGTPGSRYPNISELEEAAKNNPNRVSSSAVAYPEGFDGTVRFITDNNETNNPGSQITDTNQTISGNNANSDDQDEGELKMLTRLAKTGDMPAPFIGSFAFVALSALILLLVSRRRFQKRNF